MLILVASVVCLCHFGPFHSVVQAQVSTQNSTTTRAPNTTTSPISLQAVQGPIRNNQSLVYQQFAETIRKLKDEFESQGDKLKESIQSEINDTIALTHQLYISTIHLKHLNEKAPCRLKQLCNVEKKINRYWNKTNVAFFAQRSSSYNKPGPIPFSINRLNAGGGFNATAGVFTAPVPGTYHFYFSGLKTKAENAGTSKLTVQLRKSSQSKKEMLAEGHVNSQDKFGWFPVQVQATVFLKKGDLVRVELVEGSLHESGSDQHLVTGFGGFLKLNVGL